MPSPVILEACRTPIGRFLGGLSSVAAPRLGAHVIASILTRHDDLADAIDESIFGCVLQAGLGQNPARQASLHGGLPETISAQTINKVCGSGLQSVMLAAQSIRAGDARLVLAGGFENMSAAPHLAHVRTGIRFGNGTLVDHMEHDGLTCAFEGWAMGNAAEHTASTHGITREEQDRYSAQSHHRAAAAWEAGYYDTESVPMSGEEVGNRRDPGPDGGVSRDEGIREDSSVEKLARLRTVFAEDGSVTAGNAAQISDGAAALLVGSTEAADERGLSPLAHIVDYTTVGVAPRDIFDAPAMGIASILERNALTIDDIDLVELNEAFSAQVLANAKTLGLPEEKLNICGGGIALGHPIGASGARILATLVHQLIRTGGSRGIASLCLGGGNAVSMLIERP